MSPLKHSQGSPEVRPQQHKAGILAQISVGHHSQATAARNGERKAPSGVPLTQVSAVSTQIWSTCCKCAKVAASLHRHVCNTRCWCDTSGIAAHIRHMWYIWLPTTAAVTLPLCMPTRMRMRRPSVFTKVCGSSVQGISLVRGQLHCNLRSADTGTTTFFASSALNPTCGFKPEVLKS